MEKSERFLRLFVLFDLPVATKKDRQLYAKFRRLLINEEKIGKKQLVLF